MYAPLFSLLNLTIHLVLRGFCKSLYNGRLAQKPINKSNASGLKAGGVFGVQKFYIWARPSSNSSSR